MLTGTYSYSTTTGAERLRRQREMAKREESERFQEWVGHIYPAYLPTRVYRVSLPQQEEVEVFFQNHTLLETGVVRFYDGRQEYEEWYEILTDDEKDEFFEQKDNFLKEIAALKRLLKMESWESASEKLDYIISTYWKIWKIVGLK